MGNIPVVIRSYSGESALSRNRASQSASSSCIDASVFCRQTPCVGRFQSFSAEASPRLSSAQTAARPARHSSLISKLIDRGHFIGRQDDLQTLDSFALGRYPRRFGSMRLIGLTPNKALLGLAEM
jgi:hypothetical protein